MSQKMIHSNGFGYIAKCSCCQDIQCCFGTVIFTLNRNEFAAFKSDFFKKGGMEKAILHREGSIKRYVFDTAFSDLKLSLSKKEHALTEDLLNIAGLEIEFEKELNP
ncbi:MAG: hypothetical protein Crog4KO_26380 [Crocinitomicaceae bacterium]